MTKLWFSLQRFTRWIKRQLQTFLGAIAFYTCLPIPPHWKLEFHGIARWAPVIGVMLGGLLGVLDFALLTIKMPIWVRSTGIVLVWLAVTGGLHLDGAMDTADGLAVLDPKRRLDVMADSRTGAFGVMAAIAILLLKVTSLSSLDSNRWLALIAAAGWGRWGQLVAIARYPYLKAEGKGAFHKTAIRSLWDAIPSLILMIGISSLPMMPDFSNWKVAVYIGGLGGAIAISTGAWFNRKLGGHTGDTYGAVVEWTEAIFLVGMTVFAEVQ